MTNKLLAAASAIALVSLTSPAAAQHAGHEMPMPMPAPAPQSEPVPEKPAEPMDHEHMDHAQMDHAAMGHDMAEGHAMTGALGDYPMTREASGTAWQPDASEHGGVHLMSGDWTLMAHGLLNLVYDHQSGRRGDDKAFASGMLMGMARRPIGNGTLQFKAMVSPDPIMGKRGYPLLLASGETADGIDRLIDRQHPHDLFMELSASVSQDIGAKSSVFVYAGLPGEPAFGPPAFMHRPAIMESPEAPISHHWLDLTHITFGVLTAGVALDRVEARRFSRFSGREPDEHRFDIETGALDFTAVPSAGTRPTVFRCRPVGPRSRIPNNSNPGVDQKPGRPAHFTPGKSLRAGNSPAPSPGAARRRRGIATMPSPWRHRYREPRIARHRGAWPGFQRRQGLVRRDPRLPPGRSSRAGPRWLVRRQFRPRYAGAALRRQQSDRSDGICAAQARLSRGSVTPSAARRHAAIASYLPDPAAYRSGRWRRTGNRCPAGRAAQVTSVPSTRSGSTIGNDAAPPDPFPEQGVLGAKIGQPPGPRSAPRNRDPW